MKMRLALSILVALGTLIATGPVHAQWGWGGPRYHAATAAESAARGMGDVMRSAGAANLMNSAAARNYEAARSAYIDNRLKYTKTYFEMKQINKDYRDARKGPRPTSEQLFRLAKDATPDRLPPTQLDPVTGVIDWPEALKAEAFDKTREALDVLFTDASKTEGNLSADQYKAIRQAIADMRAELENQVNDLPPQLWAQTSSFLKKLDYEVRLRS
jgi:hypothetical protein